MLDALVAVGDRTARNRAGGHFILFLPAQVAGWVSFPGHHQLLFIIFRKQEVKLYLVLIHPFRPSISTISQRATPKLIHKPGSDSAQTRPCPSTPYFYFLPAYTFLSALVVFLYQIYIHK